MWNKAVVAALFFVFFVGSMVAQAQVQPYETDSIWEEGQYTPPTAPEYCDPLPEDIAQLQECMEFLGTHGQASIYSEETPTLTAVGAGTHGMSSAYNPLNDTILFVSTNAAATSILGRLYNAQTMQPATEQFVIDQGNLDSSGPLAVYNPDVNAFFVVWQDERPSTGRSSIYGRTVEANGSFNGPDFPIVNDINVRLGDLVLDLPNARYAIGYDHNPSGPGVKFVDFGGTVGTATNFYQQTPGYLGQSSMVYNSNTNEYWTAYVYVAGNAGLWSQDERVMLSRIDATTYAPVGEPIQLSLTRPSKGLFESPQIQYSPEDGAALVVWRENWRSYEGSGEIFGRTVYDSGSISQEHPILTSSGSIGFGSNWYGIPSSFEYNQYTNTFALAVPNSNNATTYVELLSSGYAVEQKEILMAEPGQQTAASGVGENSNGFVSFSSSNNAVGITKVGSTFKSSPAAANPQTGNSNPSPTIADTSSFAQAISKLYVYALGLSGFLAVIMAVYGGYMVMTARGNGGQVSKGKEIIISALVGMVILMSAFLILNTINPELTDLSLTPDLF